MINILKQIRHYVGRLGLYQGIKTWRCLTSASGTVKAPIPDSDESVLVRTGTSDVLAYTEIIIKREYDVNLPIKKPKVIIDAGANVGYTSIFMAEKYPESKIISVEPEKRNFEILSRNTKKYNNIKTLNRALWPVKEKVEVGNKESDNWSFRVDSATNDGGSVDAVTVREIMKKEDIKKIDIMKVDIEGGEKEVFGQGSCEWISKTRSIIIELHDRKRSGCSEAFYRAVCRCKFDQYHKGMNTVWINRSLVSNDG